jgi:hypothetical protein
MPHPYLPRLNEGQGNNNNLDLPARPGNWDDGQAGLRLHSLANAIAVQPLISSIHSIPDPWARVILFDRALYEPTHPLHNQIMGEWRGLLAILGLRERRRFHSLEAQLVDLAPAREEGRGSFAKVVERLQPLDEDLIDPETTFEKFYLLKWHSKPRGQKPSRVFALTSPTTLVATGAYYEGILDTKDVPWFDGEILTDPTDILPQREKTALAEWIKWLQSQMNRVHDSVRRGWLVELLAEFAADLDPAARLRLDAEVLSNSSLNLTQGLFQSLSRAHKGENSMLTELQIVSDLQKPDAPRYVLIDPSIATQMRRDANEVVVFRNYTLETAPALALPNKAFGTFPEGGTNVRWCTPAYFFQDSLIFYPITSQGSDDSDESAFPGCYKVETAPNSILGNGEIRELVFPLTEAAAGLFTPQQLAKNFEVQWLADGGAICRLTLRVRSVAEGNGADGRPPVQIEHEVKIEKKYTKADTIRLSRPPALCVWPDFRFEDERGDNRWKSYFLFESWRGMKSPDEFVVKPVGGDASAQRMFSLGQEKFQVFPIGKFPEVLVCQMPYGNKPRSSDDKQPQGLLLLKVPEPQDAGHNQTTVVGVDFGTTGTSVYRSVEPFGPQNITHVTFKDRLFRVTRSDANLFRRLTHDSFIPGRDRNAGGILSVFQSFETGDEDGMIAVRDGHVLFPVEDASTFIHGADGSVRSNMKWGGVQENAAAQSFLTQACMETLAELVCSGAGDIKIRYSYPTAFSTRDKDRWSANWARIIQNLESVTSVPVVLDNEEPFSREAVSATRYFSNVHALATARGALTLDIGGGTTDLAVWNNNDKRVPTLMAHLSVLFAGRDLFLNPLSAKPDVLSLLDSTVPMKTLKDKLAAGQGDAYWAQLNAIISAHGDQLIKSIAVKSAIPAVEEFLKILEIGLCGIGFYSGLLVGRLILEGTYKPVERIPIFVGGNGSKLFHWCALGKFTNQSSFHTSFSRSLLAGAHVAVPDLKATVDIHVSTLPKEEVAYGLVAQRTILQISDKFMEPPAGERFILHGATPTPKEWYETVDPKDVAASSVEVESKLPIFRMFLESLDRSHLGITIADEEIERIVGIVDNFFGEAAHEMSTPGINPADTKAAASLRRSPVFFKALKAFLDTRIEKLVQHE